MNAASAGTTLPGRRHVSLLLVEDDAVDRIACRRALQKHPDFEFELHEADTGRQGLQRLQDHEFDCILLDYHLPDMTGLEFLIEITNAMGKISMPVLKLTGTDNVAIAVEAMKRGARDYLIKDAEGRYLELLPAVVERVLIEQRMLEEKQHAEMKYRTLVERIPAITYILTLEGEGRWLFVSPQIELLGFSADEWVATEELRFQQVHPEDRDRVMQAFLHSCESGEMFRCDYRMSTRTGDVRWFHDEASVVCDAQGKRLFLQGVMLDITENKLMEEELVEHRYRLEQQVERRTAMLERRIALAEAANSNLCNKIEEGMQAVRDARIAQLRCQAMSALAEEAIFDADADGRLLSLNAAAERLCMLDSEQALGRSLAEVLPLESHEGMSMANIQRDCLALKHERVRLEGATLQRRGHPALAVSGWMAAVPATNGRAAGLLMLLHPAEYAAGDLARGD